MVDVYLSSGTVTITLPVAPEQLVVDSAAALQSWSVLDRGEVVRPRGNQAARFPLEGLLPGPGRKNDPWWRDWRHPLEIVAVIGEWKAQGALVNLLIPDTRITGWDAYIESFQTTEAGPAGDVFFALGLVEARAMRVLTDEEEAAEAAAEAAAAAARAAGQQVASEGVLPAEPPPRPASYVVTEADAAEGSSWLWLIAVRFYDDGARWSDIYFANEQAIQDATGTPDSNVPAVGVELTLP